MKENNERIGKFDQEHKDGLEREQKALDDAKALREELDLLKNEMQEQQTSYSEEKEKLEKSIKESKEDH